MPAEASANCPTARPLKLTASVPTTPTSTGVPVSGAAIVPSYSFELAEMPDKPNGFLPSWIVSVPAPVPAELRALTNTENVPT